MKTSIMRSLLNIAKSFDMYSRPVTLTYKKHNSYRTVIGGLVSLLILIIILALFGILFFQMLNKEYIKMQKNEVFINLTNDTTVFNISETEWNFYISITSVLDISSTPPDHSKYYNLYYMLNDQMTNNSELIAMHPCTENDGHYPDYLSYSVTY